MRCAIPPWGAAACVVLILSSAHAATTAADSTADDVYQIRLDSLLSDVANPERSFDFVEAAMDVGDLRGATAALERILLINPQLANIQLELGVLYLRMGNAGLAQYHINAALRAPNVPETVRLRALRLLAVAGTAAARNSFHLQLSLGYRYDSDANAGPTSGSVFALDPYLLQPVLVPLTSGGKTADGAAEGSLVMSHSFAFTPGGSSWDTSLSTYGIDYQKLSILNQYSAGVQTGPTLVFAGTASAPMSIQPFGSASKAYLDGQSYFSAYGGGANLNLSWTERTATQLQVSHEHRIFDNTRSFYLTDRSGGYNSAQLQEIWQVGRVQFQIGATGQRTDAVTDYQSFTGWGGLGGARWFASLARRNDR